MIQFWYSLIFFMHARSYNNFPHELFPFQLSQKETFPLIERKKQDIQEILINFSHYFHENFSSQTEYDPEELSSLLVKVTEDLSYLSIPLSLEQLYDMTSESWRDAEFQKACYTIIRSLENGRIFFDRETGVFTYADNTFSLSGTAVSQVEKAQRINRYGDIGFFDREGALISTTISHKLYRESDETQTLSIHEVQETKISVSSHPKREKFLSEYTSFFNENFFNKFGFYFDLLSLREQYGFFVWYTESEQSFQEKIQTQTKTFGDTLARIGMLHEQDPELLKKILAWGEDASVQTEMKKKILNSFIFFSDTLDFLEEGTYLYTSTPLKKEALLHLSQEILGKGKNLLKKYILSSELKESDIEQDILDTQSASSIYANIFKTVCKENSEAEFSDFEHLNFEFSRADTLPLEKKQLVWNLFQRSTTDAVSLKSAKKVLFPETADEHEQASKNILYILEWVNGPVASIRVEEKDSETIYVGSLVVDENMKGSTFGSKIMESLLEMYQGKKDIHFSVTPEIPVGTHYVSAIGGIVTEYIKDPNEDDMGEFEIVLPKRPPSSLLRTEEYSNLSSLVSESPLSEVGNAIIVMKKNIRTDIQEITNICSTLLNKEGYSITRYECANANCSERYFGFEKIQLL